MSTPSDSSSSPPLRQITCGHCSRIMEYSRDLPSFCAYCGRPLQTDPVPETAATTTDLVTQYHIPSDIPPEIGGYRLSRRLGSGGMGVVYAAEAKETGRQVAVKLLASVEDRSPVALERFRQEGRLASMITHPHCVFVVATEEEGGRPYIVMELMPGSTLKDQVDAEGPLPAGQAVEQILDVIQGLNEAHRLGVIHRDVKPSNCFLLPDGRVKIGDFGLSKSLISDTHLTESRSFLGTPLFASPEQIKGDDIDVRTDVYSVAATLYFLLTGKAPFQHAAGAAATLACIVSEPPPPIRTQQPEVSPALERVVLRGLARRRDDRWRNLDEFQDALMALTPGKLSFTGLGMRLAAYVIDDFLFVPIRIAATFAFGFGMWIMPWLSMVPLYLYFLWLEGKGEGSLGKRWLRLRVWQAGKNEAPGWKRSFIRTLAHFLLIGAPLALLQAGALSVWNVAPMVVGVLLMISTMRIGNGYCGLHDWLSQTRVVQLPIPERARLLPRLQTENAVARPRPPDVPDVFGPFQVTGVVRWDEKHRVLTAEDPGLGRSVWLDLFPGGQAGVPLDRRELTRPTRLRWLTSGIQGDWSWHAFVAPSGWPLRKRRQITSRFQDGAGMAR